MKEIIAILRPKKVGATRLALEELGFPSQTAVAVLGRGRQRGLTTEVDVDLSREALEKGKAGGMKYVPKRLLTLVVHDDEVDSIVKTIARVNRTGEIGDGKIFVSPIDDALRVRTSATGENAIL
jgi:nitrogen regulatory protein PII 2